MIIIYIFILLLASVPIRIGTTSPPTEGPNVQRKRQVPQHVMRAFSSATVEETPASYETYAISPKVVSLTHDLPNLVMSTASHGFTQLQNGDFP